MVKTIKTTQLQAIKTWLNNNNVVKLHECFIASFMGVKNSVVTVDVTHKNKACERLAFLVETTPEGNSAVIMEVDN